MVYHLQRSGPLLSIYKSLGVPLRHVEVGPFRSPSAWRAVHRFSRQLHDDHISLLHCHDIYSNIVGGAAALLTSGVAVLASRRWWRVAPNPNLRILNRWSYRAASAVLANCDRVGTLVQNDDGIDRSKIIIIPNFLETEAFAELDRAQTARMRTSVGLPTGGPVIGIVARLAKVKDHRTLLTAFGIVSASFPNAQLAVVGAGPEEDTLRRMVKEAGASSSIHFLGQLPHRPNPHSLFDISVLCSTSEGFPNSVVEAMAAGKPVVATDVGGVRDAVRHGQTGLVVSPGDPAGLAQAILALLTDMPTAHRFGASGRQVALSEFHEDRVIPRLLAAYQHLAGTTRGRANRGTRWRSSRTSRLEPGDGRGTGKK